MFKTRGYLIVVLMVLLATAGVHMVHSKAIAVIDHEKMLVQQKIEMEVGKKRILKAIIDCESRNQHVVGTLAKAGIDIGKCQINTYWHESRAEAMGLNLYDPLDNMEYCLYLFETEGVVPWRSSQACWQHVLETENIRF